MFLSLSSGQIYIRSCMENKTQMQETMNYIELNHSALQSRRSGKIHVVVSVGVVIRTAQKCCINDTLMCF